MPEIVAVGECMIELFSDEPIAATATFRKAYSGDTLNFLYMATKLGTSCGFITRLGDDAFSDYLLEEWLKNGIDTAAVKRVPGHAGLFFISLLPGGERQFTYYRRGSAASTMAPEDVTDGYVAGARALHVSAISQAISPSARETVLEAVKTARKHNVMVSYDANLRLNLWSIEEAREAMREVLAYVDVFFLSHPEETTQLAGVSTVREAIESLTGEGVRAVAVKSGAEGAWVGDAEGVWRAQSIAPHGVSDTTGAGDAFGGAFLHCMLRGLSLAEAARWGVACAGLKVAGRGGIASQPSRDEVERYVDHVRVQPA